MALLDILKKSTAPAGPEAGTTGAQNVQTGDITALSQSKATGKAAPAGSGPAASSIASQVAGSQVQTGLSQIASQTAQQTSQLADQAKTAQTDINLKNQALDQNRSQAISQQQTQETLAGTQREARRDAAGRAVESAVQIRSDELNNRYSEGLKNLATERGIAENDIFQDFNQEISRLGVEKAGANLEQMAHAMAMSDRKYVDELQRIGKLNNLMDDQTFKMEAKRLAFQKDLEILGQQFDMNRLINADARDFKAQMAEMDINTAVELANQAAKEAAAVNTIKGITQAAGGVANYGIDNGWFDGSGSTGEISVTNISTAAESRPGEVST